MDDTQTIIKEQFKKLPKDIQDAILAVDLRDKLKMVSDKHKLLVDKAGVLENETMLVMLGLENHSAYPESIKKELGITSEQAQEITKDINEQIFLPIRESLKNIEKNNIEEAEKEEVETSREGSTVTAPDTPIPPIATPEKKEPPHPNLSDESSGGQVHSSNIFEDKLTKQVRTPKEHVRLDESTNKPQEKKKPYSVDPYREPIE